MNLGFGVVFTNLLGLFIMIGVGFASVKAKIVPPSASPTLSAILLKITLPCTIFISLATKEYDPGFSRDIFIVIAVGLLLFPMFSLISMLLSKPFGVKKERRGIWSFGASFCNNGFMGFPVALSLFGQEGLALAIVYNIPFNILVYTLGVWLVSSDVKGDNKKLRWTDIVFTNINLAIVLSLVFYFGRIGLHTAISTPITHFSNITTPLSMFITGMALASGEGLELLKDRDAYTASLLRLFVYPLISLFILKAVPFPNPLIGPVLTIIMAMPAASITTVLAETYHGNRDLAAKIIFVTSLFSMISMPLIAMLL